MASVARPLTLADVAVPHSNALTDTVLVIVASLLTAAAAQVEIRLPWTPVPITGQTFAVLLSGTVLGARRAFLAQCLYLLEGALGLPFFAGGAAGVAKLIGPTGGYLAAFKEVPELDDPMNTVSSSRLATSSEMRPCSTVPSRYLYASSGRLSRSAKSTIPRFPSTSSPWYSYSVSDCSAGGNDASDRSMVSCRERASTAS